MLGEELLLLRWAEAAWGEAQDEPYRPQGHSGHSASVSWLRFVCSDWLPGALFSVSLWWHSSCLLVLICVVLGFLFNTYTQLLSGSDFLTCSKLRLVSPFKPSLIC